MIKVQLCFLGILFSCVMFYLVFRRKKSSRSIYFLYMLLFNAGLVPIIYYSMKDSDYKLIIPALSFAIMNLLIIRKIFAKEKPDQETLNAWHDDPDNWVLGVLYFNPKDHRIFPPKRVEGFGWTVNFANPYSILVLILMIVLIIALAVLLPKNK